MPRDKRSSCPKAVRYRTLGIQLGAGLQVASPSLTHSSSVCLDGRPTAPYPREQFAGRRNEIHVEPIRVAQRGPGPSPARPTAATSTPSESRMRTSGLPPLPTASRPWSSSRAPLTRQSSTPVSDVRHSLSTDHAGAATPSSCPTSTTVTPDESDTDTRDDGVVSSHPWLAADKIAAMTKALRFHCVVTCTSSSYVGRLRDLSAAAAQRTPNSAGAGYLVARLIP
jgi:hypothetical protein